MSPEPLRDGPGEAEANLRSRIDTEPDWYTYESGYRAAADVLMASIEARPATAESLVFPLGAICRHTIELGLKSLIVLLHQNYSEAEKLRYSHNLLALWQLLRRPLAKLELLEVTIATRIEGLLESFDALDSSGEAFRYPVGRDGAPSFNQDRLNCRTMHACTLEVLDKLAILASSVFDDLDDRDEAMRDAANEWWYSLSDAEQDEYRQRDEELFQAYLDGHL